ncbi:MAG: sugar phosphate isomerase/epimerase [Planctomycetaceae bacterium]|nr:sugar phosphate isomerase/epimerase [Planctomycetaceae bacterium]
MFSSSSFSASPYDAIQSQRSTRTQHDYLQRISVNQLTTLRTTFEEDLQNYQQLGVPAIGLSCRKLHDYGPHQVGRLMRKSGLRVSSLGWIGSFLGYNGHARRESICEARKAIRMAARVKADTVVVYSGPQAGHIDSHARRLVVDSLRELVPLAQSSHVTLALMPVHPQFRKDWSFLTQVDQALSIIDAVNHPRVRLGLSTYHSWHEEDLLERLVKCAPLTALVQVADWGREARCDNDRAMPGRGTLPLREMIAALESGGYRGWYELDVWSRRLWCRKPFEVLQAGLESMQALAPQRHESSDEE